MVFTYHLAGLDCPHCAGEIEREVAALPEIITAAVNLVKQTLTVESAASQASLLPLIEQTVHKHEPDVAVTPETKAMTHTFLLNGLDCPHCAGEIEREVAALPEVITAAVNLVKQTLTVESAASQASLLPLIEQTVHKHEPDVTVMPETNFFTLTFLLNGLDCPHCAGEIEREVAALPAVRSASVNLMEQTLTVESASAAETLLPVIEQTVYTHEPEVTVSLFTRQNVKKEEHGESRTMGLRLISGAVLFGIGMVLSLTGQPLAAMLALLIPAYLVLGYDVLWAAFRNILRGKVFDEHFLMSVSTLGAFAVGEYPEAAAVMLFYQIGEYFQSLAVQRSRRSIAALMDIRPDTAEVLRDGAFVPVPCESVVVGETVLVKPGMRIPLDGTVLEGDSMLDTAALTGESVPRSVHPGDTVLSGSINKNEVLKIRTTKSFGESTASRIIDMAENAAA
ncbi:MAG: heavy metal translocating P-type ATPase, partial [Oscillospiraceae bacterium]|nr:heavy metal translocating P-type ATPase [Oscillospiraceae bacterium]